MPDIFSWRDKAQCLFSFAAVAHNATWNHEDNFVRAGKTMGNGIMMSFAVECALKATLAENNIQPARIHNLHSLFCRLPQNFQARVVRVYEELVAAEKDKRVHVPPLNNLRTCLKHHDSAFKEWRYEIKDSSRFYPGPMIWVCASLLTFFSCNAFRCSFFNFACV